MDDLRLQRSLVGLATAHLEAATRADNAVNHAPSVFERQRLQEVHATQRRAAKGVRRSSQQCTTHLQIPSTRQDDATVHHMVGDERSHGINIGRAEYSIGARVGQLPLYERMHRFAPRKHLALEAHGSMHILWQLLWLSIDKCMRNGAAVAKGAYASSASAVELCHLRRHHTRQIDHCCAHVRVEHAQLRVGCGETMSKRAREPHNARHARCRLSVTDIGLAAARRKHLIRSTIHQHHSGQRTCLNRIAKRGASAVRLQHIHL